MVKATGAKMAEVTRGKTRAFTVCAGCKIEFPKRVNGKKHGKRYCSKQCRRSHYAERFDRWIANPETIALPQNFDEFLSRDEIPCLVADCSWKGEHLGVHVNVSHGITAREFKKLCGFNVSTGLVGEGTSRLMSEKQKDLVASGATGITTETASLIAAMGRAARAANPIPEKQSLESTEHKRKAMAEAVRVSGIVLPCRECGKDAEQPAFGQPRRYCSIECRTKYNTRSNSTRKYELRCSHCEEVFMGNSPQRIRSSRGFPVCCSQQCRNQMNIATCLAKRSIGPREAQP